MYFDLMCRNLLEKPLRYFLLNLFSGVPSFSKAEPIVRLPIVVAGLQQVIKHTNLLKYFTERGQNNFLKKIGFSVIFKIDK